MNGIVLNEDNSHFFGARRAEDMTVEGCRELVDHYALRQVRQILFCPNAMQTSFASRVWQPIWDGYDPDAGDDQPLFTGTPCEAIPIGPAPAAGETACVFVGLDEDSASESAGSTSQWRAVFICFGARALAHSSGRPQCQWIRNPGRRASRRRKRGENHLLAGAVGADRVGRSCDVVNPRRVSAMLYGGRSGT